MNNSNENNDAQLWQIAKKRAAFKRQCVSYILVNALLVAIWFLGFIKTGGSNSFWPIWPIIGWGIGLAFSYIEAYESNNFFSTQKEYETLKNQQ